MASNNFNSGNSGYDNTNYNAMNSNYNNYNANNINNTNVNNSGVNDPNNYNNYNVGNTNVNVYNNNTDSNANYNSYYDTNNVYNNYNNAGNTNAYNNYVDQNANYNNNYYDTNNAYNNYNNVGNNANYNNINNNQNSNYNNVQNTNTNYYNQNNAFTDSSVVFEDKANMTPEERVRYFISGINKKMLFFVLGILLGIIVIILIIVGIVAHINSSYKANVIVPDIVYMGETANVSVVAEGKKDLNNTVTTFKVYNEVKDENGKKTRTASKTFNFAESSLKGKEVMNSIIPSQEGSSFIQIQSKLGKREMANVKKEVVVCPAFTSDLLLFKSISLNEGNRHDLDIDFGQGICGSDVTYESSNPDVFTVNEEGEISAVKIGQAILTIKKGSREFSTNVYVTKNMIDLASFSVSPRKVQLAAGENVRLKVDYKPLNATTGEISFKSGDDAIATVSDSGLIEAKSAGTTTIDVSMSPGNGIASVTVVVVGGSDEVEGVVPTQITLNKSEVNLIQGNSEKILAVVVPDTAKDKKLTWKSNDDNIASVDQNGLILAKNEGVTSVVVSTNNNIVKTIKVKVTKMNTPVITASDKKLSNQWHTKPYELKFTGAPNGMKYYYGNTENTTINVGNKVAISKDENKVYYVKACTVTCEQTCKDKKVNGRTVRDDYGKVVKECTEKCDSKPVICSSPVAYVSKLDTVKPEVLKVAGVEENHGVKDDTVQIALRDVTSLIKQWCVTNVDNVSTCKWQNIQPMSNPVVEYVATRNDTYYVFAKDGAGNISKSQQFEITNIG